jgi:pimeloyl-ACP methyl ester carboxylesterase
MSHEQPTRAGVEGDVRGFGQFGPPPVTENAARDIETVRVALGDEPLSVYGPSHGTLLGSVYATMFPDSIRTGSRVRRCVGQNRHVLHALARLPTQ